MDSLWKMLVKIFKVKLIFWCFVIIFLAPSLLPAEETPLDRLNTFAEQIEKIRPKEMGYPINQNTHLKEFYEWYYNSRLYNVSLNNVGDPQ